MLVFQNAFTDFYKLDNFFWTKLQIITGDQSKIDADSLSIDGISRRISVDVAVIDLFDAVFVENFQDFVAFSASVHRGRVEKDNRFFAQFLPGVQR